MLFRSLLLRQFLTRNLLLSNSCDMLLGVQMQFLPYLYAPQIPRLYHGPSAALAHFDTSIRALAVQFGLATSTGSTEH